MIVIIIALSIVVVILVTAFLWVWLSKVKSPHATEVDSEKITALAEFVKAQKEQAEKQQQIKELKHADQKQKLEYFKQTQEQLKCKLRTQFDSKQWIPVSKILNSMDKGGIGIYVLHNTTKNKYYVGQAKQIYKRIRDHFNVEDITRDFLSGDEIKTMFLTANELDADYRMDHIERLGIEIFDAEKSGYNKKQGSV